MEVNYKFVPEHVTAEEKFKRDVISYAGRNYWLQNVDFVSFK